MRAKNTLWLVQSYIDLIADLKPRAGMATPVLYSYRMACGTLSDVTPVIADQILTLTRGQLAEPIYRTDPAAEALDCFIDNLIGLNCENYAQLLVRLIQDIVVNSPPIDTASGPTDSPPRVRHPSPTTVDYLRMFTKRVGNTGIFNQGSDDIIGNIAQMCCADSLQPYARYTAAHDAVLDFLNAADLVFKASAGECYHKRHLPLLKAIFHLTCLYAGVTPSGVRRTCHQGVVYLENQSITDSTLAAIPLPTADMVRQCQEPTTGPISRAGSIYLTAFERFVDANPFK